MPFKTARKALLYALNRSSPYTTSGKLPSERGCGNWLSWARIYLSQAMSLQSSNTSSGAMMVIVIVISFGGDSKQTKHYITVNSLNSGASTVISRGSISSCSLIFSRLVELMASTFSPGLRHCHFLDWGVAQKRRLGGMTNAGHCLKW